ncbi:FecR family protein [Flavivirga aquimarina]|uniref:FecR family protein n=1 Tax=Flavivirga aquimarina TaxID=2027862 RepID=A0ABT8W9R9_9FLAO|nr:FecR family protein [Flavivirga aquimarina]MDO5969855.1 FecR family protein [Flavivirga aquimarina]
MTYKSKQLEIIIQKYFDNETNKEELSYLINSFSNEDIKKAFKESVKIQYIVSKKFTNIDTETAFKDFLAQINQDEEKAQKRNKIIALSILKYAAIFIGLIGIGYVYQTQIRNQNVTYPKLKIKEEVITLQREDGKVEIIEATNNKAVINKNGQKVAQQQGNKIVYQGDMDVEALVYNTIKIPYGKKFQIELSDGTTVDLNAGSSLKYPIRFLKGLERKVFITGEAYFNVTEDKTHPFVVNTKQINVSVLGTEFNLSSYEEDAYINTVLVNGKVKVNDADNANTNAEDFYLTPGQLGAWSKNKSDFVVKNVDTNIYTAWVKGKLIFNDIPFKTIRKKLERHYNVVIVNNNNNLDESTFKASFDIENIEDVLEVFNLNFGIDYQIINNKIIIN